MRIMKPGILLLAMLLGLAACDECSIIEDRGNPARLFRLVDDQGKNLWFGPDAIYDPAEAEFIHETEGALPTTVNTSQQSISVIVPVTDNPEETISLILDSATTDNLRYATLVYEEECVKTYELSYLFHNQTKVCSSCGNTDFNNDRFIYLRR